MATVLNPRRAINEDLVRRGKHAVPEWKDDLAFANQVRLVYEPRHREEFRDHVDARVFLIRVAEGLA